MRWYPYVASGIIATVLVFSGGYVVGKYGIPPRQPAEPVPRGAGAPVDMSNFWETKRLIEEKYPEQVDPQQLMTGASKGLVQGTGDPYGDYLTREEAKALDEVLAGQVEGIGVEIGERDGQIKVIAPLPDSPAAKAGIRAGDLILGVNGQAVQGQSVDDEAKQIRGQKGTEVTVEIKPADGPARSVKLVRDTVKAPSARLEFRGDVAVITLNRYGDDTKAEMQKIAAEIQARKPRGIVLDLRSNPGGYLDGAIEVTSLFQKEGVVVREQFKDKTETQSVTGTAPLAEYPLVILVNQGTASAAEITAGSLRDNRGIKLIGEKTFGKGSVQELEPLSAGAVLKLTIAEWLTPNGTSISKEGLKPDVEFPSANPDAQLEAAIQQLGR